MINPARMKDEFLDLVSISSLSRREGAIARRLETTLKAMGARVEVDDAGEKVGGETGNLLARFAGTKPGATPFLLSGHMDTVGPAEKIHVRVEGDIVRSDGTTVLGGDDKAGIGAILEAIRVLREQKIPHGDIEVVLSICEETGLLGAKHFDTGRLTARRGLVLDVDGVCELITRNLGVIEGGLSTNIVPARVSIRGEARSLSLEKLQAQTEHMRRRFEEAVARHSVKLEDRVHQARVDTKVERQYERLDVPEQAPIVGLVTEAARRLGHAFRTRATGGGSDANVFSTRGLEIANLACGMRDIHTVNEWVDLKDLYTTAALVLETLRLHAALIVRRGLQVAPEVG